MVRARTQGEGGRARDPEASLLRGLVEHQPGARERCGDCADQRDRWRTGDARGWSVLCAPAVRVTSDPAPGILGAAQPSREHTGLEALVCASAAPTMRGEHDGGDVER